MTAASRTLMPPHQKENKGGISVKRKKNYKAPATARRRDARRPVDEQHRDKPAAQQSSIASIDITASATSHPIQQSATRFRRPASRIAGNSVPASFSPGEHQVATQRFTTPCNNSTEPRMAKLFHTHPRLSVRDKLFGTSEMPRSPHFFFIDSYYAL